MSNLVYQTGQRPVWGEAEGRRGTIDVAALLRQAWRLDHAAFVRRIEAMEERTALHWWHRAETEVERARVERLYGAALARWRARCQASHGDAERFADAEGGADHA